MLDSEQQTSAPPSRCWTHYLFVAGLALVVFLVWWFGWESLRDQVLAARPWPLAGMCVLILAGFWIRAWKWRYALGVGQQGIGLFFLAKMAGNWSPGRVGELSPLLLSRHRTPQVAAWIVADRVIEVASTLFLGLLGAVLLGLAPGWMLVVMCLVFAVLAGMTVWLLLSPGLIARWLPRVSEASRRHRALQLLLEVHGEFRALGLKIPVIVVYTAIGKLTDIYAVVLLCAAFGYNVPFLLVCAARCAHALVAGIPVTPDATGVPYIAAAYLIHTHAGMPGEALTAALALEVAVINLLLWLSFLVGSFDLRHTAKAEQTGSDAE
jgi:hypothetical protein